MPKIRTFRKDIEKIKVSLPPMKNMRHVIEYSTYITRLMEMEKISPECGKAILEGIKEIGEFIKAEALLKDIEEKRELLKRSENQ